MPHSTKTASSFLTKLETYMHKRATSTHSRTSKKEKVESLVKQTCGIRKDMAAYMQLPF
jgi:hypothetical protein